MSNISVSLRAHYEERLERAMTQQALLDTAYDALLANEIESYTLDTGETRQTVKQKDASKLLELIQNLETYIIWLNQKINGNGLINVNLRRRSGTHRGFRYGYSR